MVHPLHFFTDLQYPNVLYKLQDDFYTTGIAKVADRIDRENEVISGAIFFEDDGEEETPFMITFSTHLQRILMDETQKALKTVEGDINSMIKEAKEVREYLKNIFNGLNHIMGKCSNPNSPLFKYPAVHEELFRLKQEIVDRYQITENKVITKTGKLPQISPLPKMQWMGQTNVLTTLFNDLIKGYPEKGIPPLLIATKEQIEQLIVSNFLNREGKAFDMKSTVDKYLDDSAGKEPPKGKRISIEKYHKPE